MKTVAVIPAYNEASMVAEVVRAVKPEVDEVVVVDDYSRDETGAEAAAAGAFVLRHPLNLGQGAALRTGTAYALRRGAGIIVHIDADGQHDPADLKKLLRPLLEGRVVVAIGSRFAPGGQTVGMTRSRAWLLTLARQWSWWWTGLKLHDPQNGLRAMTRQAVERLHWQQDREAHASEILEEIARLKLSYVEVPVTVRYSEYSRAKGQKNINAWRIVWRLILGKLTI